MKKALLLLSIPFLLMSCFMDATTDESTSLSSISFTDSSTEIEVGESATVYLSYSPGNADNVSIQYSASCDGIINISDTSNTGCVITGISAGSVILIASCQGYTSYLDVKVNDDGSDIDPYIVLPYVTLEIERGCKKTVLASLYGGTASDNSLFTWTSSSDAVTLDAVSNSCVIVAEKTGAARITVHNEKSELDSYFIVYVPDESGDLFYLTTTSNVVKAYTDGGTVDFSVSITGGTASDLTYVNFSVYEGDDYISVSGNNGKCTITPKSAGRAVVKVSHYEAEQPLYITVIVSSSDAVNYISANNDFVLLSGIETYDVIATMVGDYGSDVNSLYTYTVEDSSIISVVQTQNYFHVTSASDGKSKLYIKNEYSELTKEVQFIVEDTSLVSTACYISVDQSVVQMEVGGSDVSIGVDFIGGNESDRNNFVYTVDDSSIISLTVADGTVDYSRTVVQTAGQIDSSFVISAKSAGIANIEVSNPKSSVTAAVKVKVYPKGTLSSSSNYPTGAGYLKCLVGSSCTYNLYLSSGDINTVSNVSWSSSDSSIATVSGSGMSASVTGVGAGICTVTASSDTLKNSFAFTVVCASSESDLEAANIIYVDDIYKTIEKGAPVYMELNTLVDVDESKYSVSVNDSSIVYGRITSGVLVLQGLEKGTTEVLVSNTEISGFTLIIYVTVTDTSVSYEFPYTISADNFVGVVLGGTSSFTYSLGDAPDSQYSSTSVTIGDTSVCSYNINSSTITVEGLSVGSTVLTISHSKSQYSKPVYVYCASTAAELASKLVLLADDTNYLTAVGSLIYLKVVMSDESEAENLVWAVSDADMLSIDVSGNTALVTANSTGCGTVTVSHANASPLTFYITVKDEEQAEDEVVISLPSVIELLTGNTQILQMSYSGISDSDIANSEWTSSDENILKIKGSGSSCYLCGLSSGIVDLTVENDDLSYKKNIVVSICDTSAAFSSTYIINLDQTVYTVGESGTLDLSVLYGTYELPDVYKTSFKWTTDNSDIVSLSANCGSCTVTAVAPGSANITVSNEHCANSITFIVNVENADEDENISLVISKVNKIVTGSTSTITFSIINNSDNTSLTAYDSVEIKSLTGDAVEASLTSNMLRVKALKAGTAKMTLYSSLYNISCDVLFITADSQAELDSMAAFIPSDDHLLLYVGDSETVTVSGDSNGLSSIKWSVDDDSVVSLIQNSVSSYTIKSLKEGNAVITISNDSYTDYVYVYCAKYSSNTSVNISVENIINLVKGGSYITKAVCGQNVCSSGYDTSVISVEEEGDNYFKIDAVAAGTSELKISYGDEYRIILVNVYSSTSSLEASASMNVSQRYRKINIGSEFTVSPVFYPDSSQLKNTVYTDVYENNVVSLSAESGVLTVKGLNEGIAQIKVNNGSMNSFSIYVEVNEDSEEYSITDNTSYYLYSDSNVKYLEYGASSTVYAYVQGDSNFKGSESFEWSVDDDSVCSINYSLSSCSITPLVAEGTCYVSCTNIYAGNVLTFKVIVGKNYENTGTSVKYISLSQNTVAMDYNAGETVVYGSLVNMGSSSVKDVSVSIDKSNVVAFSYYYSSDKVYISLKPVTCGYGRITLSHDDADMDSYIDYIVNESDENEETVYLTTSDNYVTVKPGEYKSIAAVLKNYTETDGSAFEWTYDKSAGNFILLGEGCSVQVYGIKESTSTLTLYHKLSKNTLTFTVKVTEKASDIKYITTGSNIIETVVSSVLDSFSVSLVGDSSSDSYFKYSVSDSSILSVTGNNSECYYRGLSSGTAQITVTNTSDSTILPLVVTVIVDDASTDSGYLTSDNNVMYLLPYGNTKTVNISINNVDNYDKSDLSWYIYSQKLSSSIDGTVISLAASGSKGVITPKNEGIAKIRVVYTPLNLKLNIMVYVSTYGQIEFADSSVEVVAGETEFAEVNVPTFTDDMTGFITYTSSNPAVCSVFGTSKVACLSGVKEGSAIIKVSNSYDDSYDEIAVKVVNSDDSSVDRIVVNQSCYLLNPRSGSQVLSAYLIGSDVTEDDQSNINWSLSSDNASIKIYPTSGPESTLSLVSVDGTVQEGSAVITLTHDKCDDGYRKTIFVTVEEIQNYFTLNTYATTLDSNDTIDIEATIVGASSSDYNDIQWTLDGKYTESDGSTTEIARAMTTQGSTCTILGLNEGTSYLTAYYKGDILQCVINVQGNRYFKLVNNSLTLYPGQEYTLQYSLLPKSYTPTWYSSDAYSDTQIISYTCDTTTQQLTIKALAEGSVTLTGMCAGIGTVVCNIKVVYNPYLLDSDKTCGSILIKMYDKGTANYIESKNTKSVKFFCYPPIYYVKASLEGGNDVADNIDYSITMNHNREEDDSQAGYGTLTVTANAELPNNDLVITLQQYKDEDCTEAVDGNSIAYTVNAYYVDANDKQDIGFNLLFKRNDGSFTMKNVGYDFYDNETGYVSLIDSDNLKQNGAVYYGNKFNPDTEPMYWGESESHYLIFKPEHEGQYFNNLSIKIDKGDTSAIEPDKTCSENSTSIDLNCSAFDSENGVYVSVVNSGMNSDVGFDCMYNDDNTLSVPSSSSDSFYSRFQVCKAIWTIDGKEYDMIKDSSFHFSGDAERSNLIPATMVSYFGKSNKKYFYIDTDSGWNASSLYIENNSDFYLMALAYDSRFSNQGYASIDDGEDTIPRYSLYKYFYTNGSFDLYDYYSIYTKRYTVVVPSEDGENDVVYYGDYGSKHTAVASIDKTEKYMFTKSQWTLNYDSYWARHLGQSSCGTQLDYNDNMWKNSTWLASGYGKSYPNNNYLQPVKTSEKYTIIIKYTDINNKSYTYYIPCKIQVWDCYKNYFNYNSYGNFSSVYNDETNSLFSEKQ